MKDEYKDWDDAHFNPKELEVLDNLQGGAKYIGRGRNRRKHYPIIEAEIEFGDLGHKMKKNHEKHANGGSIGKVLKNRDSLKKMGRNGDTEYAHVGPHTRKLFDEIMGGGSVNPRSGKKEYYGFNDFLSGIGKGVKNVGRFAGKTAKSIGRTITKGAHKAGEAATRALPGAIMGGMSGGVPGALAGGAASYMMNPTSGMGNMGGMSSMPYMGNMGGGFNPMSQLSNYGNQFQNVGQNVFGQAQNYGQGLMGQVQGYGQQAQNMGNNMYNQAQNYGQNLSNQGRQQMNGFRDQMMNQGSQAYNNAQNYIDQNENPSYSQYSNMYR